MSCCDSESGVSPATIDAGQRGTLVIVLIINLLMFSTELGAGIWADSRALIADSADNLGDALVYLLSLMVVGHSLRWRSGAAFVKGLLQLSFGIAVVISIVTSLLGSPDPVGPVMMSVAAIALVANLSCFALLLRHREQDVNMRSVWLCSRNDVLGNTGVIISGALVILLDSHWPDIIVASIVALIFLRTSYTVIAESMHSWRTAS